ncbi:two-component system alkaline phosphatase synthesis response regulator PhoP [Planomicrobium stackebrandtii]|uniref:Two-component system alkaline phosphatase synthesis response regulator PhoP n=1 Tax=Planomicrobium stackebrandtii TaxID=253160 RepID=A0ABU0GUB0_9BACL|nr:response regulator transcription factor [Planomicrobium stackebrandtii]MDQ0428942.1 two-component system alkaline phosphatase synthesis response regulator PhoP [Planomicrobium stackebrandtii]
MNAATVLIVEDDEGIRELMRLFLLKKGYGVLQAEDGLRALALLEKEKPDIILLDVEMPGMNGLEVCEKIRLKTTLPILFVSYRKELVYKIQGLEAGGDDYITKPFDFNELEARIRAILRRNGWKSGEQDQLNILKYDDLHIHVDACELYVAGVPVKLYHKEFQLLLLLAQTPNRVWTAEQLYDQIWGYYSEGDVGTVKVHISNLRRKIEKDPANPQFIQTVRGFGYKFILE